MFNIKSAKDYQGFNPTTYVKGVDPENITPIQLITYKRTYAWPGESWSDICLRVAKGIVANLVEYKFIDAVESTACCYRFYNAFFNMKVLPPGRGLKYMGTETPKSKGAAVLVNCAAVATSNPVNDFCNLADMLALGCGVGFGDEGKGLAIKCPENFSTSPFREHEGQPYSGYFGACYYVPDFLIEDTREGWIKAFKSVLEAFFNGKSLYCYDYSLIRPEGAELKTMGGKASGPEPLRLAINSLIDLLKENVGKTLNARLINDIACIIARAIVSGGVRRSALIAIGSVEDVNFTTLKDDKDRVNSYGWAANNSTRVFTEEQLIKAIELNLANANGDPGFTFFDNVAYLDTKEHLRAYLPRQSARFKPDLATLFNPCAEIPLEANEVCNINEMLAENVETLGEFLELTELAYLYCKVITCLPFHIPEVDAIVKKNRRIGVGQTGIKRALAKHGKDELTRWYEEAYIQLHWLDVNYSHRARIPLSVRLTTVKPSGTVSLVALTSAGIHDPVAEYSLRRICLNRTDALVPILIAAGYHVEDSVYYPQTVVVTVPIYDPYAVEYNKQTATVKSQIEAVVWIQRCWADNAVSVTVTYKSTDHDEVREQIKLHWKNLKSLSLLPNCESIYSQLPEEPCTKEKYFELNSKLKRLVISNAKLDSAENSYCDSERCYKPLN